jgi:hypothetical protein
MKRFQVLCAFTTNAETDCVVRPPSAASGNEQHPSGFPETINLTMFTRHRRRALTFITLSAEAGPGACPTNARPVRIRLYAVVVMPDHSAALA